MNFEGSKDHLRGRNVVVGALWTMIIELGSTVVDILTRDAGVLGSIPGPIICFQCIYMLIPPFVLHFVVCPAPGTDGLTPAIEGRTWVLFSRAKIIYDGRNISSSWGYTDCGYRPGWLGGRAFD